MSMTIGRVLLGLYFLVPGLMKIAAPADTIAYMEFHEIPFAAPLFVVSTAANIICGLLLITNRFVKLTAFGSVIYILLVNYMLHDFWTMEGTAAERETQNFIKNLGILAGLLVLAGTAVMRWPSFKGWWKSDNAA